MPLPAALDQQLPLFERPLDAENARSYLLGKRWSVPFIQARPDEFLVTSWADSLTNRGTASSALVLPGTTWVKVARAKQEAASP
jgi:hypothetical protein